MQPHVERASTWAVAGDAGRVCKRIRSGAVATPNSSSAATSYTYVVAGTTSWSTSRVRRFHDPTDSPSRVTIQCATSLPPTPGRQVRVTFLEVAFPLRFSGHGRFRGGEGDVGAARGASELEPALVATSRCDETDDDEDGGHDGAQEYLPAAASPIALRDGVGTDGIEIGASRVHDAHGCPLRRA